VGGKNLGACRYIHGLQDLWQVHSIESPSDVERRIQNGVLDAFLEAQEMGKTRYIGFTGHASYKAHLKMLEELDKQIREGIDKELVKRGFQKTTSGEPDFLVSYLAVGELDLDVQEYDSGTAPPDVPYGHWRPFYQTGNDVTLIRKGTLSIDVIDPEPNRLIWRGKATETFDKPKDLEKKLNKIVKKILKKFPPK